MTKTKPEWWPKNPYPKDIFPMEESRYAEIVPDPDIRTALSGMLGRRFWEIASDMIWDALITEQDGRPLADRVAAIEAFLNL